LDGRSLVCASVVVLVAVVVIVARRRRTLFFEEMSTLVQGEFPFEKYVELFGPLHWTSWARAVEREPALTPTFRR
jgi:hypothetical protein